MKAVKVKQHDIADCGPACLVSVSKYYGKEVLLSQVREACGVDKDGSSMLALLRSAEELGFETEGVQGERAEQFKKVQLPAIAHVVVNNQLQHYMVVYEVSDNFLTVMDPAIGDLKKYSYQEFESIWKSRAVLLLKPTKKFIQTRKSELPNRNKWLFDLIKPELQLIYQGIFLGFLASILGISTSVYVQKLVDDFIPHSNKKLLLLSTVLIVLIVFAKAIFNYLRQTFLIKMAKNINIHLIDSFYSILLRLNKSFFDTRKTGEFIARMNDSVKIQQSVLQLVNVVAIDFIMVLVSLVYILFLNFNIGLFSLGLIPIYAGIVWKYLSPIKKENELVMSDYANVESNYVDHITGIDVIKSKNKEVLFGKINQIFYEKLQNSIVSLGKLEIRVGVISEISSGIGIILLLAYGSYLSINNKISVGELLAIYSILGTLIPSVGRIAGINLSIQQAFVSFDRLFEFMALRPEKNEASIPLQSLKTIEVKNIDFRYNGRKQILKDISLILEKGKQTAIVGESGSGKTTISYLFQRFYSPESGSILWNGIDISLFDIHEFRKKLDLFRKKLKFLTGLFLKILHLAKKIKLFLMFRNFVKN
jgi:ATP-binding cassette subfamily B protein